MTERIGLDVHAKPLGRFGRLRTALRRGGAVPAPRGYRPPPPRPATVRLVRFRYMLWVGVLAGGYVGAQVFGTPHMLMTYTYWGPRESPSFSTCDYWGLHSQTASVAGACPLFRVLKAREPDHG